MRRSNDFHRDTNPAPTISFQVIAMAKSLIKTWKKLVPESAEKKEKKKEEKEKSKEDKNGAEDDASAAGGLSSGSLGEKGGASFPPRPQPTSDQVRKAST